MVAGPKPEWLKVRLGQGESYRKMHQLLDGQKLHTVCQEALCPNMGRCWNHGRATLMILGDVCTRGCRFCNVGSGRPAADDPAEPQRVAEAVQAMGLSDVVITSVTRDDLPDGGAGRWAETIEAIRALSPNVRVEVLIPDFQGDPEALAQVVQARPDVLGHNLETVPSLYRAIRPQADYRQSLALLGASHEAGLVTKTSVMLGLGETLDEVRELMRDARASGCDIFYAGQYLSPTKRQHANVERYVRPDEFDALRDAGLAMGFPVVVSAPLVRSSYHSDEQAAFLKNGLDRTKRTP